MKPIYNKKLFVLVFMFLFLVNFVSASPVLLFSDLTSGPSTGWNSTTNKGVAVSIWGRNFGTDRGSSYVSIGGVDLIEDSDYAIWGALYDNSTKLEKITFWLNFNMPNGDTKISVTVDGVTSNDLNFTIRNGNIYFITPDGTGDGSYENPFSPTDFVNKIDSTKGNEDGVTGYFRGGVYEDQYAVTGWHSNFCLGSVHSGLSGYENAFIGFPNEVALIKTTDSGADWTTFRTHTIPSSYIVVANLFTNASHGSIEARSNWRVVGNHVNALHVLTATGQIIADGDNIKFYGNDLTGGSSGNKLDHAIYPHEGKNLDIGWNHIHDNNFNAGPMISINHDGAGVNNWTFENYKVHDNFIDTSKYPSRAVGVWETGNGSSVYVYNNVIIGPTPNGQFALYAMSGNVYYYHNTLFNVGEPLNYGIFGFLGGFDHGANYVPESITMKNNIVYANSSAKFYIRTISPAPQATIDSNLWYGIGDFESKIMGDVGDNLNSVNNMDPLFVNAQNNDFRLQSSSPAIDNGTDVGVDYDFYGNERNFNPDIGAYEYVEERKTYYMANESCSNSNPGTEGEPVCDLKAAFSLMQGGDTLIIEDGVYTGDDNMMSSSIEPPIGSENNYTTIKARNPGKVIFDGQNIRRPAIIGNREYVVFDGLVFKNSISTVFSITNSDHVKFLRCGFAEAGDTNNVSGDSLFFRYNDYMLIEDSYIWGNGRYKFYILDSNHVVLRRCVVRADRGKDVGYSNQGSYRFYGTYNSVIQNSISIDEGQAGFIMTTHEGSFVDSNPKVIWIGPNGSSGLNGSNNTVDGFIALNNGLSLSGFVGNSGCDNNVFKNSVFWSSKNAIWTRSENLVNNISIDHCTFGETIDVNGAHDRAVEADVYGMVSLKNSLVYGNGDSGIRNTVSDYNVFYNNAYNYQGSTPGVNDYCYENANEIDPTANSLRYITRIEDGSDLDGIASDGTKIGAVILNRIGISGTLWGEPGWNITTSESLWPFPNEDVIKEHFASYYYTNGTDEIRGDRGFAANGNGLYGGPITLTSYIWEYLGNPCPEEICNYTVPHTYHKADLDHSGVIEDPEAKSFWQRWMSNLESFSDMFDVLRVWKSG